jgi:hypothetical protein
MVGERWESGRKTYRRYKTYKTHRETGAGRALLTSHRSPRASLPASINLFSFRIGLTLAEIFVVIGQTIHEQPEKADKARAH